MQTNLETFITIFGIYLAIFAHRTLRHTCSQAATEFPRKKKSGVEYFLWPNNSSVLEEAVGRKTIAFASLQQVCLVTVQV